MTSTLYSGAKASASLVPIVATVLIGFYSHKYHGTDGVVGVLMGIYLVLYTLIRVNKWNPNALPPLRSLIYKFRVVIVIAGLAGIIGGTLDKLGVL